MNKKVIAYLRISQGIVTIYLAFLMLFSFGVLPVSDLLIAGFAGIAMMLSLPAALVAFVSTTVPPYMIGLPYNLGFDPHIVVAMGFTIAYLLWYVATVECLIRIFGKGKPFNLLSQRMHGYYIISGIFFLLIYIAKIYITNPDILSSSTPFHYVYLNTIFDLLVSIGLFVVAAMVRAKLTWESVRNNKYFRAVTFGIIRLWQLSFWLSLLSMGLSFFGVHTFIASIFQIAEEEITHRMLPLSSLNELLIFDASGFNVYVMMMGLCLSVLPLFWMENLIHNMRLWFDNQVVFQKEGFKKFSALVWGLYALLTVSVVVLNFIRNFGLTDILSGTALWLIGGALSIGYFLWSFKPGEKIKNP